MKLNVFFIALVAVAALSFTLKTNYTVDASQSKVKWTGYKVTGSHYGSVDVKSGSLEMEDGQLIGGEFVIDMTTIDVQDLSGGGKKKLEGHLNSSDFFGVSDNPTAKLVITKAIPYGTGGNYKIVANMTIKETTKEIKFKADVVDSADQIKATAKITVDRSEFDIRYGSGSFFDSLGDKTIYDEFDLEIELVASK